jgi:isoamylase
MSDIAWFTPGATEMSEDDWRAGFAKSLGIFLNGRALHSPNERGEPIVDKSYYLMFNAHHDALEFKLPEAKWSERWAMVINTADGKDFMQDEENGPPADAGSSFNVQPWSLVLLRSLAPK